MPNYLGFDSIFAKIYKRVGNSYEEIKVKVTQLHYVYSEENTDASRIQLKSDESSVVDNPDLQEFQTIYVQFGSVNRPSPKRELLIIDSQLDGQAEGITLNLSCFPRAVLLRMATNSQPMKDIFQKCGISVVKQEDLRSEDAEPIEVPDDRPNNVIYIDQNNPVTSPSFSIVSKGLFQSPQVKNSNLEYKAVNKVAYKAPDNLDDFHVVFKGDPDKDKILGQSAWDTLQTHIGNGNTVDAEDNIGAEPNYLTASDNKITVSNKDYNQDPSYSFHYKDEPGDIISFNFETGYREHLSKSNQKSNSVNLEGNLESSTIDTGDSPLAEYKPTTPNIYNEHSEMFKMLNLADPEQLAQYRVWQDIFNDNPNLQYTVAYSEDADLSTQNLKLVFFPDPVFNRGDAGLFNGKTKYEMVDPSTGKITEMVVSKDEADEIEAQAQIAQATKNMISTKIEGHKYSDPAMQAAANRIAKVYGIQNYVEKINGLTYEDYERRYQTQDPNSVSQIVKQSYEHYNPETGKITTRVVYHETQTTDFRFQNLESGVENREWAESTKVYDPRIGGIEFFIFEKVNPPVMNIDPTKPSDEGNGVKQQDQQEVTKEERELYKGTVKIVGGVLTPHIISGKVCTLYGVSKKWGGNWFIDSATHTLDYTSGYTITLKLERDGAGVSSDGLGANQNQDTEKPTQGDGVNIPEVEEGGESKVVPVSLTPQQYQAIIDVYTYWSKSSYTLDYSRGEDRLVPFVVTNDGKTHIKEVYTKWQQEDNARGQIYSESEIGVLKAMPRIFQTKYKPYNEAYAMFSTNIDCDFRIPEYYYNYYLNANQPTVQDILQKINILFGDIREYPGGNGGVYGSVLSGVIYDSDAYFREFNFNYGTHEGDVDLIEKKCRLTGELLSWVLNYLSKWSLFYRKELSEFLKYQTVFMNWLESLGIANAESSLAGDMYNIIKVLECGDATALYNQAVKNNYRIDPNQFVIPKPILKSFAQPKVVPTLGEVGWGHSIWAKWGIKTTLDTQYGLQNPDTKEPVIGITITKEQAQNLFNSDIQAAQAIWLNTKNGFGQDFNSLSINKKVALTSLSYNSGATYINEVVKLGKAGKWEELSKKWVNFIRTSQSGTETGLRNRRKVEALLLTQE